MEAVKILKLKIYIGQGFINAGETLKKTFISLFVNKKK
jgi:hypothetical protein